MKRKNGCLRTSIPRAAGLAALLASTALLASAAVDPNAVPYLSTYYIEPSVAVGSTVKIDYYVTDATQGEYLRDEPQTFTVDYWVNGAKTTLADVKSGDCSFEFPAPPKGNVLFALQATDREGRKSHRLFQEFRVVDPAEQAIQPEQVLTPDLARFGIHADDTHPVETTAGLTALLRWAETNGYRKVVLPAGATFAIDCSNSVRMASGVTLDMNGSTFKLMDNQVNSSRMVVFEDCVDAHLVNGTVQGDLVGRDFSNPAIHAEWVCGISFERGSAYCSVRDVAVRDITGYGTMTRHGHSFNGTEAVREFEPGDLDAQGVAVPATNRLTSVGFADIRRFVENSGFIQLGRYLGYQGNPADRWSYRAHLYDADRNYLETVEGYMYRRLCPRADAAFARFTLLGATVPDSAPGRHLSVFDFRPPYNCAFINVKHVNVRCVGMALAGFNNMLVEGCEFVNCGWKLARCAFDAEDGWDMMQDLTFRGNVFGINPHNEFLTCGGQNFVMEKNVMKTFVWDRTHGFVFRDNELKRAGFRFGDLKRTGYPRIYRNRIVGEAKLEKAKDRLDRDYVIRDNLCEGGVTTTGKMPWQTAFLDCEITGGPLHARVVDCIVSNVSNRAGGLEIVGSRVVDSELGSSGVGEFASIIGSELVDTTVYARQIPFTVENSRLKDVRFIIPGDWTTNHTLTLRGNTVETSHPDLVEVGNVYRRIVLSGNQITASSPDFAAITLRSPVRGVSPEIVVSGNSFSAPSGWAVRAKGPPDPETPRAFSFENNAYGGLKPFNDLIAKDRPNVTIVDDTPPSETDPDARPDAADARTPGDEIN